MLGSNCWLRGRVSGQWTISLVLPAFPPDQSLLPPQVFATASSFQHVNSGTANGIHYTKQPPQADRRVTKRTAQPRPRIVQDVVCLPSGTCFMHGHSTCGATPVQMSMKQYRLGQTLPTALSSLVQHRPALSVIVSGCGRLPSTD